MASNALLQSRRVLIPHAAEPSPACLRIIDGRIAEILPHGQPTAEDLGDLVLMPGVIDVHVHVNDPGRTDWEGFSSATRAAAAGGITTIADMPLNSTPATINQHGWIAKQDAIKNGIYVDVMLHAGLIAGSASEIPALVSKGASAVKAFLVDSGIDEFPASHEEDLRQAMRLLAPLGVPLFVHAELDLPEAPAAPSDPTSYASWLLSRPAQMEVNAIELLVRLMRETGARVHIVHVTSIEALRVISAARDEGLPLTAETCPHYLFFSSEEIPARATRFKCAPPIRGVRHRDALWQALKDGVLDLIATDHSPCPPSMKALDSGDFFRAWGGISSLQLLLPAVWTAGRPRGVRFTDLARWLSAGPASLLGVSHRKGSIAVGFDADLVAWDPDQSFEVRGELLHHRHPITPYAGHTLQGVVHGTWLRGDRIAIADGVWPDPRGEFISRDRA